MSNLIKSPFVNMSGKEARVIRYEEEGKFTPLEHKKKIQIKSLEEMAEEENAKKVVTDDFSTGIPVTNYDEIWKEKEREAERKANQIRQAAMEDAQLLMKEAKEQVEQLQETAREEGFSLGKEEGLRQAQSEVDELRAGILQQKEQWEKEYNSLLQNAEKQYVEIVCNLVRKLTGVIVTEHEDVILHLIRSAMADMESAKKYTIRVCSEDVLYIEARKEEILSKAGIEGTIEVQEEKGLLQGECIVETDTQMVDCGFRTQLENLLSTLRMLTN